MIAGCKCGALKPSVTLLSCAGVWNGIGELEMSWYVDARLTMLVSVSDSSSPSILEQIPNFLACSLDKCQ